MQESENNQQMANQVIAKELDLRRELQAKGPQMETVLGHVRLVLHTSQEEAKLLRTSIVGAHTTIDTLTEEMQHEQAQHNFESNKLVLELQAETATRPLMNNSAQQLMCQLQGSESQASDLRTTLLSVEQEAMRDLILNE